MRLPREANASPSRYGHVSTIGAGILFLACASSSAPTDEAWRHREWLTPPPAPGWSIDGTKMCECLTCEPARCCRGETQGEEQSLCTTSYDFSAPECGLSVESCTGRCSKRVWRVKVRDQCTPLPAECCETMTQALGDRATSP